MAGAADVVLFHPAPRSGWEPHRRVDLPLSLLHPATPVDRRGYRVVIVDEYADPNWRNALLKALAEKPICFGVSAMTGPQILHALRACLLVRQLHPNVPIVWGGIHPSLLPEQTLRNPFADIIVVGEGEETLLELVEALAGGKPLSGVGGIAYRDNGQYRFTGQRPFVDLDAQPPQSYHLLEMDRYRRTLFGVDHIVLHASRGCPYGCSFCWDPVLHKRRFRAMKAPTVLEHMFRIVRDYGLRGFCFTDDNFFTDMRRGRDILEGTVRANLGIRISKLQIRVDTICQMDEEMLALMVRAGVTRLIVGVESGNRRMLELLNKRITPEQVIQANRRLAAYPIVPLYCLMMGLPTETPDEFAESVRLAEQVTGENPRATRSFNIYTPYPGTEMYNLVREMGLKEPQRLEDWARFNYRNPLKDSPWMVPETKRLITGLDFPLKFSESANAVVDYKKMNPLLLVASKAYAPVARYRIRNLDGRWPVETRLVKALGLFARQD